MNSDSTNDLVCERDDCDTTENVTRFVHFDNQDDEFLCWEHREPFIRERLDGTGVYRDESETSGQSGLTDF